MRRRWRLAVTVGLLLAALATWIAVGLWLDLPVLGDENPGCAELHGGLRQGACRVFGRPVLLDGEHPVPAQVTYGLVLLLTALAVAHRLASRGRGGPVRVTDVVLAGSTGTCGGHPPHQWRCNTSSTRSSSRRENSGDATG